MVETRCLVVPLVIGDASSVLGHFDLLEQGSMVPFFDTQNIMEIMILQQLDVGSVRTAIPHHSRVIE